MSASVTVTPAMARALVDEARAKGYRPGVLGFRAPVGGQSRQQFDVAGAPVALVPCVSTLAVREAILARGRGDWLVVVTERTDDDLGAGLLAQVIGQRLRRPDVWQAVQHRFAATGIDAQLAGAATHRELAAGLLEAAPPSGWPPAPAGLLTRDHALGSVARRWLGVPDGPTDALGVLGWSANRDVVTLIGELRLLAGDELTDAVLAWLASGTGAAEPFVASLLGRGNAGDVVPLGLVLNALHSRPGADADLVVARLEHRWGPVPGASLVAVADAAVTVTADLLADPTRRDDAARVLARADELAGVAQGLPLMTSSRLMRSGLVHRLRRLADALRVDAASGLEAVEEAWGAVCDHALHGDDGSVAALRAAVRLRRWLATEAEGEAPSDLAGLARRQADVDAWVDAAVNDAAAGVDDEHVARALEHVLGRVAAVRDEHDRQFAHALAANPAAVDGGSAGPVGAAEAAVWPLENLLAQVVFPVATKTPTLLLILDGMSTATATEIVANINERTDLAMTEAYLPGVGRRGAGLSVLPSITDASRASLLSGRLVTGGQGVEQAGFAALTNAHKLGTAKLFHKKILDSSRLGFAVSDEVRHAIADVDGHRLVACVLNTIDDALNSSDPSGTFWNADAVKHLVPLLQRAADARRAVVITADHGHVVERRHGVQRSYASALGNRHRLADQAAEADEVLVEGQRVLVEGNRAVLAVSERLRYRSVRAGYHGGAAPAEVVVPVVLLVPSGAEDTTFTLAPPQAPAWWEGGLRAPAVPVPSAPVGPQPDLFSTDEPPAAVGPSVGADLVATKVFADQRALAGRVVVTDAQIRQLVDALALAPDRRLTAAQAAAAVGASITRVAMVLNQAAKLVNVEGYPVLSIDAATGAVLLDEGLLAEQYGIGR